MTDVSAPADPEPTPSESPAPSTESPPPSDAPSPEAPTPPSTVPDAVAQRVVAGIDSSVEQGNRVVVTDPITRTNPLEPIIAKVEDHFSNAAHIVDDLRALAAELETLLNTLKAGL